MSDDTRTWPELAIGLFDQLTGRDAEITYNFENLKVSVPSKAGGESVQADWQLNGKVSISTKSGSPNPN